jgi:hypothetical protein
MYPSPPRFTDIEITWRCHCFGAFIQKRYNAPYEDIEKYEKYPLINLRSKCPSCKETMVGELLSYTNDPVILPAHIGGIFNG